MGLFEKNIQNISKGMQMEPSGRVWEAIEAGLLKQKKIKTAIKIALMLVLASLPMYLLDQKIIDNPSRNQFISRHVQKELQDNRSGSKRTSQKIPLSSPSTKKITIAPVPTVLANNTGRSEIFAIDSKTSINYFFEPGIVNTSSILPITQATQPFNQEFVLDELPTKKPLPIAINTNSHQHIGLEFFAMLGRSFRNSNLEEIARGAGRSALINASKNGNGKLFQPTTCLSFGVKNNREITNRLSFQYGLGVSLLGWNYFAVDVSNSAPSSSNSVSTRVLQANNGPNSSLYQNRLWFADIPLLCRIKTIDNRKFSLNLFSGATTQARLSDNFSILSPGSGKYYTDESMISKFNIEANLGAALVLKSGSLGNIGLSLEGGYQLLSIYKINNPLKENIFGIQAGLVFQLKK